MDPVTSNPSNTGAAADTEHQLAIELSAISKRYAGVVALDSVTMSVRAGEVHAVVGENGAGKSTLIGIAAGVIEADGGSIRIAGRTVDQVSPSIMKELGVATVYQHPALAGDLTVLENLLLGVPAARRPGRPSHTAWARESLARAGLDVGLGLRVSSLSVSQRHLLEIAKALASGPRVLILDEPTEPLSATESEQLFSNVAATARRGVAVIYISHRLPDVERISSRLTVLRDGRHRGTFDTGSLTQDEILQLIIGRSAAKTFPPKAASRFGPVAARISATTESGLAVSDLELRRGEVVGLAGIDGNGQRDLMRVLAGLNAADGELTVHGESVRMSNPAAARAAGIAYLPGDRHGEGIFPDMSVRENISLFTLPRYASLGFVSSAREKSAVAGQVRTLAIKTPSTETTIGSLSGGNQQKSVFARAMLAEPALLLADEPTQGVDAGARIELYRHLRHAAESGSAVVVLSSDALELQGLCDRVLTFSRGQVTRELTGADVTEANITQSALTATTVRARSADRPSVRSGFRKLMALEQLPSILLALLILLLATYTEWRNPSYFSAYNITNFLLAVAMVGFISLGQFLVVMLGGVDLSVGPLAGLLAVVASLIMVGDTGSTLVAVAAMAAVAVVNGLANGLLIRLARLSPVIATLVTYFVLQGIALLLRPTAGGVIPDSFIETVTTSWGVVPVAFVALVLAVVGTEFALRRSTWGIMLRATGSSERSAHRVGVRTGLVHVVAYVACALLTLLGAILLTAQIGVGQATAGNEFTLASIAAVVIGGTSIAGGRGSAVGVFLAVILLQQITNVSTFLQLDASWQYWLLGLLTLTAAAVYSRSRRD